MLYDKKWDKKIEVPALEPWRQALLDAAKIIEEKGWVQNDFSRRGSYCAVGAINKALGRRPTGDRRGGKNVEVYRLAHDNLFNYLNSKCEVAGVYKCVIVGVEAWNDDLPEDEGKNIVIKTLRSCANKGVK